MNDLISVIVPIYNVELYLSECIESIMIQTYRHLEIILVDDGSTDLSGSICEQYARQDDRICVYHKENEGLVLARKFGLSVAKGNYIWFVDGDDYVEYNMAEYMIRLIHYYDTDFIHSGYYEDNNEMCCGCPIEAGRYEITDDNRNRLINEYLFGLGSEKMSPSIWSKLYKRELIIKSYNTVPNEQSYGEDVINLYACFELATSVYIDNKAFYHYRIRTNSMSHRASMYTIENFGRMIKTIESLCINYGNEKLIPMVYGYFKNWLVTYMKKSLGMEICIYEFPEITKILDKKIVLYGAGVVGKDYYAQISKYVNCKIVGWVDKNPVELPYRKVNEITAIKDMQFDYIVIAVKRESIANEIRHELTQMGIATERILWKTPRYKYED